MARNSLFYRLSLAAVLLTLAVVVLGAYVRLSDAGLGCPDWPGCYGYMMVPKALANAEAATLAFPDRPLEADKAWKEMVHRYFAGALGLLTFGLAWMAWRGRHRPGQPVAVPLGLTGLIVFQALLGMWTVTLLLKPLVVMAHLMGGLATLALFWWLVLRQSPMGQPVVNDAARHLRPFALLALGLVVVQIMLGGWTSANYAALACPDFPTCQAQWWPPMDFREAFTLWRGLGVDYEGGVLGNDARVTIHMMHRLGAVAVLAVVGTLAFLVLRRAPSWPLRLTGAAVALLLVAQLTLGLGNVLLSLPLGVAVAHNGVAALLLLALLTLNYLLREPRS